MPCIFSIRVRVVSMQSLFVDSCPVRSAVQPCCSDAISPSLRALMQLDLVHHHHHRQVRLAGLQKSSSRMGNRVGLGRRLLRQPPARALPHSHRHHSVQQPLSRQVRSLPLQAALHHCRITVHRQIQTRNHRPSLLQRSETRTDARWRLYCPMIPRSHSVRAMCYPIGIHLTRRRSKRWAAPPAHSRCCCVTNGILPALSYCVSGFEIGSWTRMTS